MVKIKRQDPTVAENERQGQQLAIDNAAVVKSERRIKRQDPTITDKEQQGQQPVQRHYSPTTEKDLEVDSNDKERRR
jgi:hypothetical protein